VLCFDKDLLGPFIAQKLNMVWTPAHTSPSLIQPIVVELSGVKTMLQCLAIQGPTIILSTHSTK